jgi:ribosomal protein S18 acetylase RimI-like enzyme
MSWLTDGSVFAAEATHIALADNELQGIEIGFGGSQWLGRKAALGPLWKQMLAAGGVTQEEMTVVLEHSGHASWLNPVVPEDVYYVHALSVTPAARGKGVGMKLLSRAMDRARDAGYRGLQLDVLSDNPAVNFYQSMGLELLVESRAPKPQAAGVPPEFRMGIVF